MTKASDAIPKAIAPTGFWHCCQRSPSVLCCQGSLKRVFMRVRLNTVGKTGSALAAMRDSRANKTHNATTTTSYAIFNRRWAENSTGTQTQRQLSGLRQSDDREMWQQSNLALGARRTSSLRPLVGERNRVASCLEVMLSYGATRDHKVRFGG